MLLAVTLEFQATTKSCQKLLHIGFTYIDEGRFEDLLTLIQKEGKDRSRLISYLSNRLVSLGETKTALALLQIDKSINPSIDLNHERLSELINNQKAMKH
jgi:hypothetical protein